MAAHKCPNCTVFFMRPIGERTGGFSGGKAVVGAVLLGPLGLLGGTLGKKKVTYKCTGCGYTIEK